MATLGFNENDFFDDEERQELERNLEELPNAWWMQDARTEARRQSQQLFAQWEREREARDNWGNSSDSEEELAFGGDDNSGFTIKVNGAEHFYEEEEDFSDKPDWVQNFTNVDLTDEEWKIYDVLAKIPCPETERHDWFRWRREKGFYNGERNEKTDEVEKFVDKLAGLRSDSFVRLVEKNFEVSKKFLGLADACGNRKLHKRVTHPKGWDRYLQDHLDDFDNDFWDDDDDDE